ncbi:MAG TPA: YsnF/AvaK domain-containing protein [Nitrososphaeraceae archaeon]|nr:YsnF/AvaK domain-containing protein [Nitrososphaeraceae archaeon]
MASSRTSNIDWNDVIKKEARGSGDEDLGEVQETGQDYVLVQRGIVNKEKFYIPKDMVESYDGDVLRFSISENDAKSRFLGDSPPSSSSRENEGLNAARIAEETSTTVPITEERLDASKRESTREATITKEPITETKTVEVPVTHEEISVERRPASGSTKAERPVQSKTETKVPLKQEEVQVTKQPYVKEEVSVKKKPVTETRKVTDKVTSEKVKVKGASEEEEIEE